MHTSAFVMHGMVAIVKEKFIENADKISGMIQFGFFIGMNMLHIIKNKHAEQRKLMRNGDEEQCFFPVEIKRNSIKPCKSEVLEECEIEFFSIGLPKIFQIISDGLLLVKA